MNKFIKYILPCAFAGVLFAGCNDIAPEDRFIELPPVEGDRVVLLEDYTGQKCPNCPDGARIIEQLKEQYGDRIIPVSIHAGDFAVPVDYNRYLGLMQPFGNDMARSREVATYPSGVIDGGNRCERGAWAAGVRDALSVPSTCDITFSGLEVDNIDNKQVLSGTISMTLLPRTMQRCAVLVGVWLLEDGIVARQYNVNGDNTWTMDYVHNHVMRAYYGANPFGNPLVGNDGEAMDLLYDVPVETQFSFIIDESWKAENLSVVAFVKDAESGVYMQSSISKL